MESKLNITGVASCGGKHLGSAWTLSQLEQIVSDADNVILFGVVGYGAFSIIIDETYTPVEDIRRYLCGVIPV